MTQEVDVQPLQVPNVFVVPPEEDEVPAWCCFDAALPIDQQIARSDDMETEIQIFDPTIDYDEDIATMDAVLMGRRNTETRSIVDTLMTRNYNIDHTALDSDSDLDWDSENEFQPHTPHSLPQHPASPRTDLDAGNDSDVIEVVKVSRSRRGIEDSNDHPAPPPLGGVKRSATFKDRATKAFRSFTGTFRSSKPQAQDNLPPRPSSSMSCQLRQEENMEQRKQTLPRPVGSVSRRFSQLFSTVKSRNSLASFDEPTSPTTAVLAPSEPAMPSRSTSSVRRPSVSYDIPPAPRRSSVYQESISSDTHSRAPSPNPSTSGKSVKRFSKLNLQRMFSFPSNPAHIEEDPIPTPPSVVSGRTTPTLKRKSSSLPSTSSESSGPQTPTSSEDTQVKQRSTVVYDEEGQSPQLDFGDFETGLGILPPAGDSFDKSQSQPFRLSSSSSASVYSSSTVASPAPPPFTAASSKPQPGPTLDDGEVSFEMRLDSLHFDSISFDADRFLVGSD